MLLVNIVLIVRTKFEEASKEVYDGGIFKFLQHTRVFHIFLDDKLVAFEPEVRFEFLKIPHILFLGADCPFYFWYLANFGWFIWNSLLKTGEVLSGLEVEYHDEDEGVGRHIGFGLNFYTGRLGPDFDEKAEFPDFRVNLHVGFKKQRVDDSENVIDSELWLELISVTGGEDELDERDFGVFNELDMKLVFVEHLDELCVDFRE